MWAFTLVRINLAASLTSQSVVAFLKASYASNGNLLSITIGPGGLGKWIKQSARFPFDSVTCQAYASDGRALLTISCN